MTVERKTEKALLFQAEQSLMLRAHQRNAELRKTATRMIIEYRKRHALEAMKANAIFGDEYESLELRKLEEVKNLLQEGLEDTPRYVEGLIKSNSFAALDYRIDAEFTELIQHKVKNNLIADLEDDLKKMINLVEKAMALVNEFDVTRYVYESLNV